MSLKICQNVFKNLPKGLKLLKNIVSHSQGRFEDCSKKF